jgi:RecA-family ATPase
LRGLAIESEAAVALLSHPSLTGMSTDSGLSGSTGWHNSARGRWYLKAFAADGDANSDRVVLEFKKNNYGPKDEQIVLRWRNGVYVPEARAGTFEQMAAERKVDEVFIDLLRRFTKEGRNVCDKKGTSFAPALFSDEPDAKANKIANKALGDAMRRLFAAGKIRVVTEGPVSKQRSRIIEIDASTNHSSTASTSFHQPSSIVPPLPPIPPPLGGRGQVVVEATAPPTKPEQG